MWIEKVDFLQNCIEQKESLAHMPISNLLFLTDWHIVITYEWKVNLVDRQR